MRPQSSHLAAAALFGLVAPLAVTASASAAPHPSTSTSTTSHSMASTRPGVVRPHVKRAANDVAGAASPDAKARSCGSPTLVTSVGGTAVVGVHDEKTLTYTVTLDDDCLATDDPNVLVELSLANGAYYSVDADYTSTDVTTGYETWTATFYWDPSLTDPDAFPLDDIGYAGAWAATVRVPGTTGFSYLDGVPAYVKRYSTLTVDASEPTKKGATETVVGRLARANWDDALYHGYINQPVDLQFRTTTGTYSTLKTVDTDSSGNLRTTTKATVEGCYRWKFTPTATTTPAATAVGDCVDVT